VRRQGLTVRRALEIENAALGCHEEGEDGTSGSSGGGERGGGDGGGGGAAAAEQRV
jgi:hypothetical protein